MPNFPSNPYTGQVVAWQGAQYMWDGEQWVNLTAPRASTVPVFVSASSPQPPLLKGTFWFNTITQVLSIWVLAPGGANWQPVTEQPPENLCVFVSISPPEDPVQGALWYNPHTHLFQVWVFNGIVSQWEVISDCEPDIDNPPVIVSVSSPENPVQGTLWYRPSNQTLYLWVDALGGGSWKVITGSSNQQKPTVYISASPPPNPLQGDLWLNPSTKALKAWNINLGSGQWIDTSPSSYGCEAQAPVYVSVSEPVNPKNHYLWFNPISSELRVKEGTTWELVSTTSEPPPPPSSVSVSPPPNPEEGYLWFNPNTGSLSVWYEDIDGGQWVSATVQGPAGPAGPAGPQGPVGPPPPTFVFNQSTPSNNWTIAHNLGFYPSVELLNSGSQEIEGGVTHLSTNVVVASFTTPVSGIARLT